MIIKIKEEEIKQAKEQIKEFDKIKIYNKFPCKNNYIGILGEIVFNRYLNERNIAHKWVKFVKKGYNTPDFVINGKTFDIKTTRSSVMWFQKPIYNVYIYAYINENDTILNIKGWTTKKIIEKLINENKIEIITRNIRKDYIIKQEQLNKNWLNVVMGV